MKRLVVLSLMLTVGVLSIAVSAFQAGQQIERIVEVEKVKDNDTLSQFVHVSSMNFDLPEAMEPIIRNVTSAAGYASGDRFSHYLGLLNGEPVATSTGYKGDRVISIQNITTLPQARRQGVGTAVTLAPILEARDLGYNIASLQASKMGYPMYEKMGFREYMRFTAYIREPKQK